MTDWTAEQIKTIRNLCDIALILLDLEREELLPTVLELMLGEVQDVVDENCVVREDA